MGGRVSLGVSLVLVGMGKNWRCLETLYGRYGHMATEKKPLSCHHIWMTGRKAVKTPVARTQVSSGTTPILRSQNHHVLRTSLSESEHSYPGQRSPHTASIKGPHEPMAPKYGITSANNPKMMPIAPTTWWQLASQLNPVSRSEVNKSRTSICKPIFWKILGKFRRKRLESYPFCLKSTH